MIILTGLLGGVFLAAMLSALDDSNGENALIYGICFLVMFVSSIVLFVK